VALLLVASSSHVDDPEDRSFDRRRDRADWRDPTIVLRRRVAGREPSSAPVLGEKQGATVRGGSGPAFSLARVFAGDRASVAAF
jgi:hypothetical protein